MERKHTWCNNRSSFGLFRLDHLLQNSRKEPNLVLRRVLEKRIKRSSPLWLIQDFEPYIVK